MPLPRRAEEAMRSGSSNLVWVLRARAIHGRVREHLVHMQAGGETAALRGGRLIIDKVKGVASAAAHVPSGAGWPKRCVARGRLGFGQRFRVQVTPYARHNKQVDTDALRRPRAAHAPGASRRSHAR